MHWGLALAIIRPFQHSKLQAPWNDHAKPPSWHSTTMLAYCCTISKHHAFFRVTSLLKPTYRQTSYLLHTSCMQHLHLTAATAPTSTCPQQLASLTPNHNVQRQRKPSTLACSANLDSKHMPRNQTANIFLILRSMLRWAHEESGPHIRILTNFCFLNLSKDNGLNSSTDHSLPNSRPLAPCTPSLPQ